MLSLFLPANAYVFAFFELSPTRLIVLLALIVGFQLIKRKFAAASWQAQQWQMAAISLLGCVVALSGLALGKINSQQALSIFGIFAAVWLTWRLLLGRATN